MDCSMSYATRIGELCKKVMGRLMFINRVKDHFDKSTRTIVVESLALSQINYCNNVWSSASKTQLQRVQKLQNFAAKVADGSARKFDHVAPIINDLKWLKIDKQCDYNLCCLVFKVLNFKLPDWFLTLPTVGEMNDGRTRQAGDLFIPRTNLNVGSRAFNVWGPRVWNRLPVSIRIINSLTVFKTRLKHFLLGVQ